MMRDALYVLCTLWCVCSMLVCFTNYDKSLHLILVQPIPFSPGWLKESLVPSFHQKNFCNKIGCTFLIQGVLDKSGLFHLNTVGHSRVVYDRVRKRKNNFEIPAFLQIERGKSRAGKFKTSNENKNVLFLFSFDFEFPALEVPRS